MNADTPIVGAVQPAPEPVTVAINGKQLPPFHAMVVLVALQNFASLMSHRNALGQNAEELRKGYLTAIEQINTLYMKE